MRTLFSTLFLLLMWPAQAAEHAHHGGMARSWTDKPLLKTKASGESRERMTIMVVPQNIVADGIDAWSNRLSDEQGRRRLPLELAGAKLDKQATGGFHWLAAREERSGMVRVASAVHYYGERGAENPTAMFMTRKHELEIVPLPYPREHSRYRADEEWKFLVRFNGRPLAEQKVMLETSNGSRVELSSDANGEIVVRIPDDFKAEAEKVSEGGHGRRGADFVLATEHAENGKRYLTAFNAGYGPDAWDQRSIALGVGFTLLGMLGAAPLLRQRGKERKEEENGNA